MQGLPLINITSQEPAAAVHSVPEATIAPPAFCFNPNAPSFDPSRPPIQVQNEFTQELYEHWVSTASTWGNVERSSSILTYMVDHRSPEERCDVGREVHLYEDYTQWEARILQTWRDQLQLGQQVELFVVHPLPPFLRPRHAACVLLVQTPADTLVSSLVTVFEGFQQLHLRSRSVITTYEHITLEEIIERLDLSWRCTGPTSSHVCQANFGSVPLRNTGYIPGRNGYSIVLQIRNRPPPNLALGQEDGGEDGVNFLQINIKDSHAEHFKEQINVLQETIKLARRHLNVFVADEAAADEPELADSLSLLQFKAFARQPTTVPTIGTSIDSSHRGRIHCPDLPGVSRLLNEPYPPPLADQSIFVRRLFARWQLVAREEQDGERSSTVSTYFVNHQGHPQRCDQGRLVHLGEHYALWETALRLVWRDLIHPTLPLAFYVVIPPPFDIEEGLAAYVIMVQNPLPDLATSLVSVYDHGHLRGRSAVTTSQAISHSQLIHSMGFHHSCTGSLATYHCEFWNHEARILDDDPFWSSSGTALYAQLQPLVWPLTAGSEVCERQTSGKVAHTRWPQPHNLPIGSSTISAPAYWAETSSVSDPESSPRRPVQLIKGHDQICMLPTFIEVSLPICVDTVNEELSTFGLVYQTWVLGTLEHAICFATDWIADAGVMHIVYTAMHLTSVILHSSTSSSADHLTHMQTLYKLGFEKAVILDVKILSAGLMEVQFIEHLGQAEQQDGKLRTQPYWPSPQPCLCHEPLYVAPAGQETSDAVLSLGVDSSMLHDFFNHSKDYQLCCIIEGLELPELVQHHLESIDKSPVPNISSDVFDRLIIYTDGSSHSGRFHRAPEFVEDNHIPDSWAFVVLGEKYDGGTLHFVGWCAHQVRCSPDHEWHLGSRAIGPWIAEREALILEDRAQLQYSDSFPFRFSAHHRASQWQLGCSTN